MTSNLMPLAERMRPQHINEVIGQSHLLGDGKPLRLAFESGEPHSMIFWGPPGVGKTTLARLMANAFDAEFIAISAVLGGVKEIREAVERAHVVRANTGRRTILFVDEVHRFNKSQQDAFLPHVESGLFIFVGATTENPSFEVNNALLSRSVVYVLKSLQMEEMKLLLARARELTSGELTLNEEAAESLILYADGDARKFLNSFENLALAARIDKRSTIDLEFLKSCLGEQLRRFDKGGDAFYDQISALHKSVRGSDPDAALYWLLRMIDGGVDPLYLGRRLIRMASEDIGLADPRALRIALDAVETWERLGSPEGDLALAESVIYLACAAKSNACYNAYKKMRQVIAHEGSHPVPEHLRNAPTKLMKELGFGKTYRYAHDEPHAYAAGENYFPDGMKPVRAYEPVERGLEIKIGEKLRFLRELDAHKKNQNE